MKVSDVNTDFLKQYLRVSSNDEYSVLTAILVAGINYIRSYSGLTLEQIDTHEDITVALLVLCSEMFDNRALTVANDKVNPVVSSILAMHSVNYL